MCKSSLHMSQTLHDHQLQKDKNNYKRNCVDVAENIGINGFRHESASSAIFNCTGFVILCMCLYVKRLSKFWIKIVFFFCNRSSILIWRTYVDELILHLLFLCSRENDEESKEKWLQIDDWCNFCSTFIVRSFSDPFHFGIFHAEFLSLLSANYSWLPLLSHSHEKKPKRILATVRYGEVTRDLR